MDIQTEIQSCLDCLIDLQKCANERNDLQDICAKQGRGNGGVPLFFNVIKSIVLPMGPMTEDGLYQHISPIKMVIHHHISSIYHPYLYHHISPYITMTWRIVGSSLASVTILTCDRPHDEHDQLFQNVHGIPKGTNITNPYKSLLLNMYIYI